MKLADVSNLLEQLIDAEGNGIVGFTIHYGQGYFENVLFRFNSVNRQTIHNETEAKRQVYLKSLRKPHTTINQHITKVKSSKKRRLI